MKKLFEGLKSLKEFFHLLLGHSMGRIGFVLIVFILIAALFAPMLWTVDPQKAGKREDILLTPSGEHWLGTDDLGRDVWSQILYGSRVSLMIGLITAFVTVVTGTLVGLTAGYFGGWIEEILVKIIDFFMMLPVLPLMIILAAVLGPNLWNIILVISVVSWPTTARVVRSQVLSIKERPYVEAARCIGAGNVRLMFGEIMPNVLPLLLLYTAFNIAWSVLAEAGASFLGFSDPNNLTWGGMLYNLWISGKIRVAWWWFAWPSICIILLVSALVFVSRAYEEVANPRLRER